MQAEFLALWQKDGCVHCGRGSLEVYSRPTSLWDVMIVLVHISLQIFIVFALNAPLQDPAFRFALFKKEVHTEKNRHQLRGN